MNGGIHADDGHGDRPVALRRINIALFTLGSLARSGRKGKEGTHELERGFAYIGRELHFWGEMARFLKNRPYSLKAAKLAKLSYFGLNG